MYLVVSADGDTAVCGVFGGVASDDGPGTKYSQDAVRMWKHVEPGGNMLSQVVACEIRASFSNLG